MFFPYIVFVNKAHVATLKKIGYLSEDEFESLYNALNELYIKHREIKKKYTEFVRRGLEDGHSVVELLLTEMLGELGSKLHLFKSRNDEMMTVQQLFIRDKLVETAKQLIRLCNVFIKIANDRKSNLFPTFTHLQVAQPSTFGHYILSYCEATLDILTDMLYLIKKLNRSPLGAGAIAGTPAIDNIILNREYEAKLLGFDGLLINTIYATSSRGLFVTEAIYMLTKILSLVISRMCEDLLIWNLLELISIDSIFTTGSSAMPQKRNLDIAELIIGYASVISGNLSTVINLTSSLPTGYMRAFQVTKKILVDSFRITTQSLSIFTKMIQTIAINEKKVNQILNEKATWAADAAYLYAVKEGIPFRKAYTLVKEAILSGEKPSKNLIEYIETAKNFSSIVLSRKSSGTSGSIDKDLKLYQQKLVDIEKELQDFIEKTKSQKNP